MRSVHLQLVSLTGEGLTAFESNIEVLWERLDNLARAPMISAAMIVVPDPQKGSYSACQARNCFRSRLATLKSLHVDGFDLRQVGIATA